MVPGGGGSEMREFVREEVLRREMKGECCFCFVWVDWVLLTGLGRWYARYCLFRLASLSRSLFSRPSSVQSASSFAFHCERMHSMEYGHTRTRLSNVYQRPSIFRLRSASIQLINSSGFRCEW